MVMRKLDPKVLHGLEDEARKLGRVLDDVLNPQKPRTTGFALLLFSFDGPELTWLSNAAREDMLSALQEFMQKAQAGALDELSRPKGRG